MTAPPKRLPAGVSAPSSLLEIQRCASIAVAAVAEGKNLNAALAAALRATPTITLQQRAAVSDAVYGTLRFGFLLQALLDELTRKQLRNRDLRWLLLVALYQLQYTRAAPHAVVDHAVRGAAAVGEPYASGLVNAVLRTFLRRREQLLAKVQAADVGRYAYPQWWIDLLRAEMPDSYSAVLAAGNQHPPFTLRVNQRRTSPGDYLALLARQHIEARAVGEGGVTLVRALPVSKLPGFREGWVSVQDAGAQRAAPLLDARNGMRVLDACAAPGGKTAHLLELADLHLTALDIDAARLQRVRDNLRRLQLSAQIVHADLSEARTWWDGVPFDRILADLPCSASGVVRRHPDIKWLRRASDIPQFALQQQRQLGCLWPLLASGGKLLYTTCSIFQEENAQQVSRFLARHADAKALPLSANQPWDGTPVGLLPPDNEHDGFFYALLQKL